jgi:hypothetical protein
MADKWADVNAHMKKYGLSAKTETGWITPIS